MSECPTLNLFDRIANRLRADNTDLLANDSPGFAQALDMNDPTLTVESHVKPGLRCRFRVASDRATRERAYRLAHDIYSGVALSSAHDTGMVVSPYDAGPETFTLLAETMAGKAIGTVSLVFDSKKGLPCDEIYWLETSGLRAEGRSMAEVTRLAIRKDAELSRDILLRLFNLIYIYARRVRRYSDFVIEVHPRHLKYYERTLGFQPIGDVQACARVGGAPAVLGRLDLAIPEAATRYAAAKHPGNGKGERSLYPGFWRGSEEAALADHLALHYRPMAEEEAAYFGLEKEIAAL